MLARGGLESSSRIEASATRNPGLSHRKFPVVVERTGAHEEQLTHMAVAGAERKDRPAEGGRQPEPAERIKQVGAYLLSTSERSDRLAPCALLAPRPLGLNAP